MPSICSRRSLGIILATLVGIALIYDTQWVRKNNNPQWQTRSNLDEDIPKTLTNRHETTPLNASRKTTTTARLPVHPPLPVIDIISIGSQKRPDYQRMQKATIGQHASVRHFWAMTEQDDVDPDCSTRLEWRDVQNISGFCGGKRRDIQHHHRLLYELKVKFAKPQWLERTKADPAAWLCAQKRPMAGFHKALTLYASSSGLPDFVVIMDDDTYYNMHQVARGLAELQQEQHELYQDDSMVVAGCAIRSRLKHFKWSFPFGGWGTIFSKGALQNILEPLYCGNSTDGMYQGRNDTTRNLSARFCPKLWKDRIGEYRVYQDGMSLADVMYQYVMKEPYVDHASWSLGFCLHSDWVWGYMVNYYNVSVAMGRRSKDLIVDRLGAYLGSEINPPYSDALLKLRRQCDFDSDQNCTKEAHMCHYITPQHMQLLWSQQQQGEAT